MLTIELKFNEAVLKTIETDKEVINIGRNIKNDIQIDNLSVSKMHARILKQKGKYYIEDLNSTNGTYLNEKKVSKEMLNNNDVITVGKHTLVTIFEKKDDPHPAHQITDDTMMLTTEKHKQMLENQKRRKK